MGRVSIYVNTLGRTEEQFAFYAEAFGTQPYDVTRMGDMPAMPGTDELPEADRDKLMHIALPILGGTVLMGTDMLESMGHTCVVGNNVSINLEPDTVEEGQRLFDALSAGAAVDAPFGPAPWGAYWGSFEDRYGVRWMVNVEGAAAG